MIVVISFADQLLVDCFGCYFAVLHCHNCGSFTVAAYAIAAGENLVMSCAIGALVYCYVALRSEERRVGKACRSWWEQYFSSRRRHTRSLCDWSSDVCSSDLDDRGHQFCRPIARGLLWLLFCRLALP